MKLCVLCLLALASSASAQAKRAPNTSPPQARPPASTPVVPSAVSATDAANSAPVPDVPAYAGSLAQGLAEMEHLSEAKKNEEALRVGDELLAPNGFLRWKERARAEEGWKKTLVAAADPLLDALGLNGAEPADRAAVHYAKGVVRSRAGQRKEAQGEFEAARSLAGPGDLRIDAIYDLGTTDLMEGESQRAEIPEIKGAKNGSGAPNVPVPSAPPIANPNTPGGAAAQPPDPLELAKQAYLRARDHFVERLRADWSDADARANTELVMRRLKELEELKKKREEQKKEQEKQDKQKKDDKDQKKSDKDKSDKQDQDSKDKQDSKDDPNKDKQNDAKDQKQDQPKPDEKKPDDQKKDGQDEKKSDEAKDKEQKDAQAGEEKEQLLTKEEVMRLLDRLNQIEEKGREMQMQLRHSRRAKVKKDW